MLAVESRGLVPRVRLAGRPEAGAVLLEAGADVSAKTKAGGTPLGLAVERGNTEVAKLLREHGGTE